MAIIQRTMSEAIHYSSARHNHGHGIPIKSEGRCPLSTRRRAYRVSPIKARR
jgi:hypothetical protein